MMRLILLIALILPSLNAAPNLVILVRHAERESSASDSPISAAGQARAQQLPRVLEAWTATGARIRAIFATERLRTQQTVAPLSQSAHVPVTILNANQTTTLVKKVLAINGGIVVIAGHSNTLPEIMEALGAPSGIEIEDADFSHLFLLTKPGASPAHVVDLHY
jgi:phosphohistidine phosphatase SixA